MQAAKNTRNQLFNPFILGILVQTVAFTIHAQQPALKMLAECRATLTDSILTLENSLIERRCSWNAGDLKTVSLTDKSTNHTFLLNPLQPDAVFPGTGKPSGGKLEVHEIAETPVSPAHLEASETVLLGTLEVKRVFRIYPGCPAIACDYYLRGKVNARWTNTVVNAGDLHNIETAAAEAEGRQVITQMEQLAVTGKHWRIKAVQFYDVTDRNNNLVQEYNQLLYRGESRLPGNILFAEEMLSGHGVFILKEAPPSSVQLSYPGFDFAVSSGKLAVAGIGIVPDELDPVRWTRCYGMVTGVTSRGELGRLTALRSYQQQIRRHLPGRDDMILMNTWGDRSQDRHIGEAFTMKELEAAKRLGVTHFQIDDGWQTGRSANSAFAGGTLTGIWRNPDYWKPSPEKFPNGLAPVVALGKKLGIEVCLWFNPSKDSSYLHWEQDAAALIELYRRYGIRTFKIDGVQVNDKPGEINLRRMFDTLMQVTDNQAVFNLDVTAGRRYGYHYFNQYGNIFLENRYTDWSNYYPHWTLRNLWMLSRYVPAQNLQIEFLNNFRNAGKYSADDPLAPSRVSFEYEFALTMMAQPLAWLEATGLPEQAFRVAPVIQKYHTLQSSLHQGKIFPIGEEPSGTSWTGFQSMLGNKGYLLVIRENNPRASATLATWLGRNRTVTLEPLLGEGRRETIVTDQEGRIKVSLPGRNTYALYEYRLL